MTIEYVFTYGSLMEYASRTRSVPSALYVYPVEVKGMKRGWFEQNHESKSIEPTYLGAISVKDEKEICNGVIFAVDKDELKKLIDREKNYDLEDIDLDRIEFLDHRGGFTHKDVKIYFFKSRNPNPATPQFPIVQSYVDICVSGCLQVEKNFAIPKEKSFVKKFFKTTVGWDGTWFNDRIYPWRPFIYVPNATAIDEAIKEGLEGENYAIQLPSFLPSNVQIQITQGGEFGKQEFTIKLVGENK